MMKHYQWIFPPQYDVPVSPVVAVLMQRGVTDEAEMQAFLSPSARQLHDPFLLKGMDAAVQRIRYAMERNEAIAIYGDYDVDGVASITLLCLYLREKGARVSYYVPDRMEEGYGLHKAALKSLVDDGISLVITVDCGITSRQEAAYAKDLGLDLIITDHHLCDGELPACTAVIDPHRPDCSYPFKYLCGAGVAFKLLCALEGDADGLLRQYADILALATVADIVSLTGENRVFVSAGLEKMRTAPHPGLAALIKVSATNRETISTGTVGFQLAPRINAAGRLDTARTGVELFLCNNAARRALLASDLDTQNMCRKQEEDGILQSAMALIRQEGLYKDSVIVVAKAGWHHGVIGIVASKIVETFYKPCVVLSIDETGEAKGSCRSIAGVDIHAVLSECCTYLTKFGGHAMAAGLTLPADKIDDFRRAACRYVDETADNEVWMPKLHIDAVLTAKDLCHETVERLQWLEPFGIDNPTPVVALLDAKITAIRPLSEGKHIKLVVETEQTQLEVLAFSKGELAQELAVGDVIDIAGALGENTFRNQTTVQLQLKDYRLQEAAPQTITRAELGTIYKHLATTGQLPKIHSRTAALTLAIFEELGLVKTENGSPVVVPTKEKVDLAQSKLYMEHKGD